VPNLYERYYGAPGTQKGNTDLVPERVATTELAYERSGGATRFAGSIYHYRIRGIIEQVTDPADGLQVFVNGATVTARGAEAELEHRFRSGLRLKGSVGYYTARSGETRLDNSPRMLAKFHASAPLLGERLRLGLEALYVGQRDGRGGGVAGRTVLNLTASARLGQGAELRASAYNVGGVRYADPASATHVQDRIYQDGRVLRIEILAKF
jgi:iron complex outermembrane receptor protein